MPWIVEGEIEELERTRGLSGACDDWDRPRACASRLNIPMVESTHAWRRPPISMPVLRSRESIETLSGHPTIW
jgi:hypothetical protein